MTLKALIDRNKASNDINSEKSIVIKTPFMIVETDRKTLIDCSISNNRY